jgi:hypothetical protein
VVCASSVFRTRQAAVKPAGQSQHASVLSTGSSTAISDRALRAASPQQHGRRTFSDFPPFPSLHLHHLRPNHPLARYHRLRARHHLPAATISLQQWWTPISWAKPPPSSPANLLPGTTPTTAAVTACRKRAARPSSCMTEFASSMRDRCSHFPTGTEWLMCYLSTRCPERRQAHHCLPHHRRILRCRRPCHRRHRRRRRQRPPPRWSPSVST